MGLAATALHRTAPGTRGGSLSSTEWARLSWEIARHKAVRLVVVLGEAGGSRAFIPRMERPRLVCGLQKGSCWPGWAGKRGEKSVPEDVRPLRGTRKGTDSFGRKESSPTGLSVLSEKYSWTSSWRKEIHQNHHLIGEVATVKHTALSEFTENVAVKSNAEAKVMFERATIHCDDCMSLSFKVMLNYEMEK